MTFTQVTRKLDSHVTCITMGAIIGVVIVYPSLAPEVTPASEDRVVYVVE